MSQHHMPYPRFRSSDIPAELSANPIWRHYIDSVAALQTHMDAIRTQLAALETNIERLQDALSDDDDEGDED